jgi:alpha-beta hydrolase superfamily lysophospholipase
MYERSCHEILNDVEREQVMTDMLDWIECREKTSRLYAMRRH